MAHPMKPWDLHERWTKLITGECVRVSPSHLAIYVRGVELDRLSSGDGTERTGGSVDRDETKLTVANLQPRRAVPPRYLAQASGPFPRFHSHYCLAAGGVLALRLPALLIKTASNIDADRV